MLNELIEEIEVRLRVIIREEIRNAIQELNDPEKRNVSVEVKASEKIKVDEFPTLLNSNDVAKILGINVQRVWELVRSRKQNGLPVILIGERQYRFSKEAVLDWINKGGSIK